MIHLLVAMLAAANTAAPIVHKKERWYFCSAADILMCDDPTQHACHEKEPIRQVHRLLGKIGNYSKEVHKPEQNWPTDYAMVSVKLPPINYGYPFRSNISLEDRFFRTMNHHGCSSSIPKQSLGVTATQWHEAGCVVFRQFAEPTNADRIAQEIVLLRRPACDTVKYCAKLVSRVCKVERRRRRRRRH